MNQNKVGILTLAMMISLSSLICGAQVVKAENGDFNEAGGILLKDTDANGKIDEVHITVDYATTTANAIEHKDSVTTTISKFTVTDTETGSLVTVSSIDFVDDSGDGAIAVFKLGLNESNVSDDTSETALDIIYDATDDDLKITDGVTPASVEAIGSDVVEKDGAAPVAISSVYKDTDLDGTVDRIDVTYSENIEDSTFIIGEWSFPTNPHVLVVSSGTFSATDVLIVVANDSTDSMVPDDTTVKYTAGTGMTDGTNSAATSSELSIGDGEEEDDDDGNDGNGNIEPPVGSEHGPAKPNLNSGVTLYRMPGDSRVYVIKNKKKHWIKTPKEFEDANYSWSEIQEISAEIIEQYPDAEPLVSELLRAIGDHKVYKLEAGKKRWIKTLGEFNDAGHKWEDVQEVSSEVLASYQNVVVSELLRAIGDHKVYKIKDGKKRWIKTLGEFNTAGHHWKDVQEVSAQDLDGYPDSDSDSEGTSIEIVNALSLRVRNASSTAGDILGSVKKSEVYEVIEKKNGWYKIKMKSGKAGWVSGSYAEEQ